MTKAKTKKTKYLFLDRDGVLVVDHHYVHKIEDLELFDDVATSLQKAKLLGFRLAVVTNQSGIARGYFSLEDTHRFHEALNRSLIANKAPPIDAFYICPHHPKGSIEEFRRDCECRKPKTGLLMQANRDLTVDWQRSFLIGDKVSDIDCAHQQNLKAIQINHGQYPIHPQADGVVTQLSEAISLIKDLENKRTAEPH